MLFDLRGRGRRRTVQTIYLGLALLMVLGLVGFGVGSGLSGGGFLEGLASKEGGATSSYAKQVERAQKRAKQHPGEAAAWVALARAQLLEADKGEYYDQETGKYTTKGKEQLRRIASTWERYLRLNPSNPSAALARDMGQLVFVKQGLNEPLKAEQAWQLVIASEPKNVHAYGLLAESAYLAKDVSTGELAAKKAIALAPKSSRPAMEATFEQLKQKATGASATTSTGTAAANVAPSSGTSAPSSGTSAPSTGKK